MIIIPTEKRFDWQHAPIVLIAIILLNVLVFMLYQSGDGQKVSQALQAYAEHDYLEREWPVYEEYLRQRNSEQLADLQASYDNGHSQPVVVTLLFDTEFFPYLTRAMRSELPEEDFSAWQRERTAIHERILSMSFLAHGLVPNQLSLADLLTHQFLHGGLMHLLGNLFFLAICGFAVEAAIGHGRFLAFYLLSGMAGGLGHALLDLDSAQPLVGASGAISGVMAMYLAVFRLRRIEFFYWLFFLVGYIRAPALLILPFYIGKELYSYYTDIDSNVAFMAHTGGFVAGAALIGMAWLLNRNLFNTEYIEADQNVDPRQQRLAGIYEAIGRFQFRTAITRLNRMIEQEGVDFELASLRYNLLQPRGGDDFQQAGLALLTMERLMPRELIKVAEVCRQYPDLAEDLGAEDRIKLGMRLASAEQLPEAEALFLKLQQQGHRSTALGILARKLSLAHQALRNPTKHSQYERWADDLMMEVN